MPNRNPVENVTHERVDVHPNHVNSIGQVFESAILSFYLSSSSLEAEAHGLPLAV